MNLYLDIVSNMVCLLHFLFSCLSSHHPLHPFFIYCFYHVCLCFPLSVGLTLLLPTKDRLFPCSQEMYPLAAPGPHIPSPVTQQKSNWLLTLVYRSWGRLCPCGIMCPFPYQSVYQAYNEQWMAQSGSHDHPMAKECQAVWLTALSRLSQVGKEFPKENGVLPPNVLGKKKKSFQIHSIMFCFPYLN